MLYRFGRFTLHAAEFRLQRDGATIALEPKALHLLLFLVARPGRLVRKQEILDELWPDVAVTDNALTRCVTLLRRALADDSRSPEFIETVPRLGYRFVAPVEIEPEPPHPASAPEPLAPAPDMLGPPPKAHAPPPESNLATLEPPQVSPVADRIATGESMPEIRPAGGSSPSVRRVGPRAFSRIRRIAGMSAAVMLLAIGCLEWRRHTVAPVAGANGPPDPTLSFATLSSSAAAHRGDTSVALLPAEARGEYQRGLYFLDRRNADASIAAFRKVIALAPGYSRGYAGLALALVTSYTVDQRAVIPEAVEAAKKAIRLDPEDGDAYIALGTIQTLYSWEWTQAELNLTRGLQLSPGNATGHIWYGVLLQGLGRQDAAVAQTEQAVAIAPLSFYTVRMHASVLYFARRYDEALPILERAREMQPQRPNVVDMWISWADERRGLYDDAVAHDLAADANSASPVQLAQLQHVYRQSGWRAYWQTRLQQMPPGSRRGCALYSTALIYLRIGERTQAVDALHDAAAQHCFWLGMVHIDPALDPLRDDPRFQAVEGMVGGGAVSEQKPTRPPDRGDVASRAPGEPDVTHARP